MRRRRSSRSAARSRAVVATRRAVVVVFCAACAGAPPAVETHPTRGPIGAAAVEARRTPATSDAAAPRAPALEGEIRLKEGTARGRLVIGWRSADEQKDVE